MTFDYPFMLFSFVIFIPLFFLDILNRKKRARLTDDLEKKLFISIALFRLFFAFSIVALSGPRWGTGYAPAEYKRGLDIVFAIDVSRSMDIHDARRADTFQSRLERGLSIARETAASVTGARFAAAVGRGRGYLAIPLTYDNEAALVFLESIDIFSMTGRSTNLESLVEAAAGAFQSTSPASRVIVLISDGESHSGILRNALNQCASDGIIVSAVAVGSDEGREIPEQANVPDSLSVMSRRDASVMKGAAERTGGIYIDGDREDAALTLSSHLLSLSKEMSPGESRSESKQRRTLFIVLALIAYGASKFITRQYKGLKPPQINQSSQLKRNVRVSLALIFASIFLFTSCIDGKLNLMEANYLHSQGRYDEALLSYLKAVDHEGAAPYAEYGLGLTFYLMDQSEAALNRYNDSQKILENFSMNEHRELRYRNHYNTGIIFFEKEDFHSAAASFREALKADPQKIEAKRNLELSLMSITMQSTAQKPAESRRQQREILFDYLKEEEQQHWKSREWTPEDEYAGQDY